MLNAVPALNELDAMVFNGANSSAAPKLYDNYIEVPDAHLLFNGDFKRVGTSDLKITGDDGQSFFIQGYFDAEKRAHLMSPDGATLSPSVVEALAGPLAPGQYAQAGAQPAPPPIIGRVDALTGSATVVRNGVSVALDIGDTVRRGDVVQTSGGSSVAIVFADGTTFTLNANARMVLDNFVYSAGGTGNSALINLVQGTFSFVAGQVAKTGDMRVETPVATMGIRGTAVLVEISANDGQTRFSVMVEPDGTTGAFNLYNKTTGALIGTVSSSQIGWVVSPVSPLQVVAQQVQKTPGQLQQELGIVQQLFTIFNNNQQNPFVPDQRGDLNDAIPQTAQGSGGGSGGLAEGGVQTSFADLITSISNGSSPPTSFTHPLPNNPLLSFDPDPPPQLITVTVATNQPPIAVPDPDGIPDGGDVIGNDSDPEGGDIFVQSVQHIDPVQNIPAGPIVEIGQDAAEGATIEGTYGTLTIHADGTYTFVPHGEALARLAAGEAAVDKFQYTIRDPFGATASAILTVNVTGENDAPEALPVDLGAVAEDGSVTITAAQLLAGVDDIDGPAATITSLSIQSGSGKLVDNGNDTWTYTPAADDDTAVTFAYTATDGSLTASSTASLNITPVNDAPEALPVDLGAVAEDGSVTITAAQLLAGVDDIDGPAATITSLSIQSGSGKLVDNGNDTWTYTPAADDDTAVTFAYTATDGSLTASSTASLNITPVNDAPEALPVDLGAVAEDGSVTITAAQLLAGVDDIDGPAATITSLSIQSGSGKLVDNGNDTWTYTPAADDDTAVTFAYTATDGSLTASSTASLNITPVNDAPEALPVDLGAVAEDGSVTITAAQLLAGVDDIDGPAATITSLSIQSGSGKLVDNGNDTWTYTPAADDDTAVTFAYTATDGSLTASSTASLNITPVNDAPEALPVDLGAVAEDGSVTITAAQLLAGVDDIDGPAATITSLSIQSGSGKLVDNGNDTWTYTPAADDDTAVTFAYTATDGSLTASSTASLNITPVNDAPTVAHPIAYQSSTEDALWSFTVPDDTFADIDGDTLAYSATLADGAPLPAWLSFDATTRTFSGQPPENFHGDLALKVTCSDGTTTASDIFALSITPVNDAPEAKNDVFENITLDWTVGPNNHFYKYVSAPVITWQNAAAAALATGGYLATITSDAENNVVFSLVRNDVAWLGGSDASLESQWRWVTEPGSPAFTYTHWASGEPNNLGDGEYSGQGEDYLVTWGSKNWNDLDNSLSDRLLVDGYVIERNGLSGVNYLQINENSPFNIAASLLLANDTDLEGDTLSIQSVTPSSQHGATVSLVNGQIVYNASQSTYLQSLAAGQTATDTFEYTISDGHGGTSAATVTVIINGINDAPTDASFAHGSGIASAENALGSGLGALKTLGTFNGIDADQGARFTYSLGSGSSNNFLLASNGELRTAIGVSSGTYTLKVIATDEHGASSAPIPFTIWVGNGNDNTTPPSLSSLTNDVIAFGLNGNDRITTGSGNDILIGGKGNDILTGGLGDDKMFGGAGADMFVFRPGDGHDTIADFNAGQGDRIDLSAFADIDSIADLTLSYTDGDTIVDIGGGPKVTVQNATLNHNDFIFHPATLQA